MRRQAVRLLSACVAVCALAGCGVSPATRPASPAQAVRARRADEDRMLAEAKAFLGGGGKVDDVVERDFPFGWVRVYRTRLKVAAAKGYAKVVAYLLEKGADPNFKGECSGAWTAVHWGATPEVLEQLVKAGGDIRASSKPHWGWRPIHFAAAMGWPSAVQWYLDKGIDAEVTTNEGETPLHFARDAATAKVLLDAGANPNAKTIDTTRWGARWVSASSTPKFATPLHYAALRGDVALLKCLLAAGAAPRAIDKQRRTPLHFAAEWGRVKALEFLLGVTAKKDLSRLLRAGADGGHVEVCRHLLARKANPNAAGEHGRTALHHAVWVGYSPPRQNDLRDRAELVRMLLSAGAKVDCRSAEGETPLIRAVRGYADATIVELLIDAKADVNARDKQGSSALHEAADNGDPAVVNLLLRNGADPNAVDGDGARPVDRADAKEHPEVKELLRKHTKGR